MSSRSYHAVLSVLFGVSLADVSWAADLARASSSERTPLVITSDRLDMNDRDHQAVFSGQVRVVEGGLQLNADRMVVTYYTPAASRKKGSSQQGLQIREVRADGRVVMQQAGSRGEAERAVYKVTERTLALIGDQRAAVVQRGEDRMEGNQILVALTQDHRVERLSVQGNEKRRVAVRVMPSSTGILPAGGAAPAGERER
ncbi:MAG: hypothetical protein HQL58_04830 [Magnetococcales bacterium]|nr:hypothetical protein [Magnetococcales bacterium]